MSDNWKNESEPEWFALDHQQHATVMAALRFYQERGLGDPDYRSLDIHDIATDGDTTVSLDDEGIDDLCGALQTSEENMSNKLIVLTAGTAYKATGLSYHDERVSITLDSGSTIDMDCKYVLAVIGYTRSKWNEYKANTQWGTKE